MSWSSRIARGVSFALAGIACQEIAGIEEREFKGTALCREYCDTVMEACTGSNAVYASHEICLKMCALMPQGVETEPRSEHEIACRLKQARLALDQAGEADTACLAAGPGGNGVCGSDCEAYCDLLSQVCPREYAETPKCEDMCKGLVDLNTPGVFAEGDSLQCRLVHLGNALTLGADPHCSHSRIYPTAPCAAPDDEPPDCEEFCNLTLAVCTDDLQVYESREQCLAVCEALDPGTKADTDVNTAGCRMYHTFSSILYPSGHCAHTGPGGDGHCPEAENGVPGSCVSYCSLLRTACEAGFDEEYGDLKACHEHCKRIRGSDRDSGYSVHVPDGNTLQCRLLYLARTLEGEDACESALGRGSCQ